MRLVLVATKTEFEPKMEGGKSEGEACGRKGRKEAHRPSVEQKKFVMRWAGCLVGSELKPQTLDLRPHTSRLSLHTSHLAGVASWLAGVSS